MITGVGKYDGEGEGEGGVTAGQPVPAEIEDAAAASARARLAGRRLREGASDMHKMQKSRDGQRGGRACV